MIEMPVMKTIRCTARDFSLPEHFVRQLCKGGKICCVRAGTKYLINQQRFAEFLNAPSYPEPGAGECK